ncbi:MAG: hypothetical protein JXR48_02930 [Candidatus Delongbacteria bacterium]|nr:hypothetical protein [Candidatus Delongbacteria bacterium]MBN2833902.1 hypothetical protein [Candidatus Delongbacteria bacterium]
MSKYFFIAIYMVLINVNSKELLLLKNANIINCVDEFIIDDTDILVSDDIIIYQEDLKKL